MKGAESQLWGRPARACREEALPVALPEDPQSNSSSNIASQSLGSSVVLVLGNTLYNGILGVASLVVARLLGPSDYGSYSLVLVLPVFLQLLAGAGIAFAISRYSAYHIARGEAATARRMTLNGIAILALFSAVVAVASWLAAGTLSAYLLNRAGLVFYVRISSLLIVGVTLWNAVILTSVGWGAPLQASVWTVLHAVLRLVLSVALLLLGYGLFGAVSGAVFAPLLVGVAGVAVLYRTKLRDRMEAGQSARQFSSFFLQDVRKMIGFGLPLYVGNILLVFSQTPYLLFLLAPFESNATIGFFSVALILATSLNFIANAVTTTLLPTFSKLESAKLDTSAAFRYSVRYFSYFIMPLLFFLLLSAPIIIGVLYGRSYLAAVPYFRILLVSLIPNAFGLTVLPAFFSGKARTRFTMTINVVEAAATLIPAPLLAISLGLGVLGVLYALVISNLASTGLGLYLARRYFNATVDWSNLARNLLASLACFGLLYVLSLGAFGRLPAIALFFLEFVVFFGLYLTLGPILRVVERADLVRLRDSSRNLGVLSRIFSVGLRYEFRVCDAIGEREGAAPASS